MPVRLLPRPPLTAHAVFGDLLDLHLREIGDHVRLNVPGGIVHLIEQLLLAGLRRHRAAGAFDLGDHEAAVLADFADGKAEPRQIGNILVAGIGEVAAGDLAAHSSKCPATVPCPSRFQSSIAQPKA